MVFGNSTPLESYILINTLLGITYPFFFQSNYFQPNAKVQNNIQTANILMCYFIYFTLFNIVACYVTLLEKEN